MSPAPRKPRFEEPCNGCGLCCAATPCELAIDFVPGALERHPCPALVWEGGRALCGLVVDPRRFSPEIAGRIAALAVAVDLPESSIAQAYGDTVRELLGDGSCDAGDHNDDPAVGLTLLEFLEPARAALRAILLEE